MSIAQPAYSGAWRRFWALVVDACVQTPFSLTIQILFGHRPFEPVDWKAAYWTGQALTMLATWIYDAGLESSRWQGTLGQQLLGIRVTDRHGRRVSFARATARHFGQYLSLCTLGIGYLMIVFTARKQALHDLLAGCLLVRGGAGAVHRPTAARHAPGPPPTLPVDAGAGR